MGDQMELARFMIRHRREYERRKRPIYICASCKRKKEREAGDLETAPCTACGNTMHVRFIKKDP